MQPHVRLFLEQEMARGEHYAFPGGGVIVFAQRSPDKETVSEDGAGLIALDENRGVLAVADGAGGMPSGEKAARVALRALSEVLLENHRDNNSLRAAILDGFDSANRAVLDLGVGAATTLAAAEIDGRLVRTYHVGDSEILITGQRGRIKLHTISHSPVGYATEAGFLGEDEAMLHEDRNLVSNLVGMPDMHIEIGAPVRLAPKDTLLITTDGLADNLTSEEIIDRTRKGPLGLAADRLADDCMERMRDPLAGRPSKPDDTTFFVYRRG